jgi:hypothetical protein
MPEMLVSAALVGLLVLGIVLEWLDWTWPALALNAGFFAFAGFGVLGRFLWGVLTRSPTQRDPEAGLAITLVGIPCAVIAVLDFVLYWNTRARIANPESEEARSLT